jgi:hypothetical protein
MMLAAQQSTFATAFPCALVVLFLGTVAVLLLRSARNRRHRTVRMYGQKRPQRPGRQWRGRQ